MNLTCQVVLWDREHSECGPLQNRHRPARINKETCAGEAVWQLGLARHQFERLVKTYIKESAAGRNLTLRLPVRLPSCSSMRVPDRAPSGCLGQRPPVQVCHRQQVGSPRCRPRVPGRSPSRHAPPRASRVRRPPLCCRLPPRCRAVPAAGRHRPDAGPWSARRACRACRRATRAAVR